MAVHEVTVFPLDSDADVRAIAAQEHAALMFGTPVVLATAQVYQVELPDDHPDPAAAIQKLATGLLADPVTEGYSTTRRKNWDNSDVVQVGYRPGVQDPAAAAITRGAQALGITPLAVATAVQYNFAPGTAGGLRDQVVDGLLMNKTVQSVQTALSETLIVRGEARPVERIVTSNMSLAELRKLSRDRSWHMGDNDLLTVQSYFAEQGCEPTEVELEFVAGRRSDHCAHLTFGANVIDATTHQTRPPLFNRIKNTARELLRGTPNVLSAFDDNAGVMKFYGGYAIALKKESHNSPSAVEPFGGSGTGTGGCKRDILGAGKGFKPILLDAVYATAPVDMDVAKLPVGCLRPRYLRDRIIAGGRDYGNKAGVPTGYVTLYTHENFRAKPTVLASAIGIAPEKYAERGQPLVGDRVITIGGRTGRDGLHGATFSSGNMTAETSTKNASSVQIGDPIQQKKVTDALLEARDAGLIRAVTDCGAAGYGSAVGEMGENTGVTIDLSCIPTKYEGMEAWELLMSESQERMVLAVPDNPDMLARLAVIMAKHDVEWADIGFFDGSNRFTALHEGEVVADLDYAWLRHGFTRGVKLSDWAPPEHAERPAMATDWNDALKRVLSHDNVCSTEPVMRQYDHMVQGNMVLPPFSGVHHDMPNDGVALMPLRDEFPDRHYGLLRTHAVNPAIMSVDPYNGAIATTIEALSRFVAIGGCPENNDENRVVLMNNYVWPTPEDAQTFGSLEQAVDGVNTSQRLSGIPVISGKDSVSSRYKDSVGGIIDIPPVLDITVVGAIPDARKTLSADIKKPGSTLVLVGLPDYEGMAGSIFNDVADGESARIAHVDEAVMQTLVGTYQAIQTGKVWSVTAISRGGLLSAVSKMSFGGDSGAELHLGGSVAAGNQLFNETAGCFVVEVESAEAAAELFDNLPHAIIGHTTAAKQLVVYHGDDQIIDASVDDLKAAWKQPMEDF
ncbi:MAG TPA: AIR synthase-related protein [Bacillota bacterium]|nr:AIR synthase-related protein [Bacillota bacterium]